MKKHRFDPVSFLFGLVFVGIAGAAWITGFDLGVRWFGWAGAAILIAAGLAMLAGSQRRMQDNDR